MENVESFVIVSLAENDLPILLSHGKNGYDCFFFSPFRFVFLISAPSENVFSFITIIFTMNIKFQQDVNGKTANMKSGINQSEHISS